MKLIEDEKCPRCGAHFTCSKSGKCWCYEVSVSTLVQDAINKKYSTCLCPECLQLLATNSKIEV